MILVNEIKGKMAAKGLTQEMVAQKIGMAPRTFSLRLKKGVFGTDEADKLIEILDIQNAADIFFAKNLT